MIILGLGSNMGDKFQHLRQALQAIKKIPQTKVVQISPIYISDAMLPENAPADWDMPYLNLAIRCESDLTLDSFFQQTKQIEWSIGTKPEKRHWGPRVIDIDILAWDNLVIQNDAITIPHKDLYERPFALWPFADVAPFWQFPNGIEKNRTVAEIVEKKWGSRFDGEAPFHTRQINQRIDMPALVGIINVTPNSFSDGGQFYSESNAITQAKHLVASGAEILDIGAESTAPQSCPLDPVTEWVRLEPVLLALKKIRDEFCVFPKISIDTRHATVAQKALEIGVDWINDVTGLQDPHMREIIAQARTDCVVMHHITMPHSREHTLPRTQDGVRLVYEWAAKLLDDLQKSGIPREKIIFDPGIGYGKTPEQSLALIKYAAIFEKLGCRLLIGHSRKSFLSLFTPLPAPERDIETLAITSYLSKQPIDYLRVHDVAICAKSFKVAAACEN